MIETYFWPRFILSGTYDLCSVEDKYCNANSFIITINNCFNATAIIFHGTIISVMISVSRGFIGITYIKDQTTQNMTVF